jgi:phytoene/squalene synthetase
MKKQEKTWLNFGGDEDFRQILTNPILDIAARFWEKDRYEAFQICYRSMRKVDDLVDHRKAGGGKLLSAEIREYRQILLEWLEAMRNRDGSDPFRKELLNTLERFKIPFWPWERLFKSMIYDLEHDGFRSFPVFLRYSEGAAIAPASVFMHLCGVYNSGGEYRTPSFDIRLAARPLALFSYLVHIIRDFEKDQKDNLNYFADDLMAKFNLNPKRLRMIAEGAEIDSSFRGMMEVYKSIAEFYRQRARTVIDGILCNLQPQYQLSLEIIYQLYLQIFEKIDSRRGLFTGEELNPAAEEIQRRIENTVGGFSPVTCTQF